jgi:hypothetical protein
VRLRGGIVSDREARVRTVVMAYFPMFIATLSLVTSIYNGYLNGRFVDLAQSNVARLEYMKACKEIIDDYFQVKFRTALIVAGDERTGGAPSGEQLEAANAVNKFAALGTYLANLRNEDIRQRYTELSRQLEKIVAQARQTPADGRDRLFEPADRIFSEMNGDCVKSAKAALQ